VKRGLVAWLIVASGCTLVDRRPELQLLPAGDLVAGLVLTLEVRASGADTARVFLDGEELRQIAVNQRVQLRAVEWAPGRHTLRVRLDGTPYPRELERAVIVGAPPPEIRVTSPVGPLNGNVPFDIVVESSEELDLDPGIAAATAPGGAEVPIEPSRPDERTVRIRVPRPIAETGPFRLSGAIRTRYTGYVFPLNDRLWAADRIPVSFVGPAFDSVHRGPVPISLSESYPVGGSITVRAACGAVTVDAATVPAGTRSLTWDPSSVPDGQCTLSASGPGWADAPGPRLYLDRAAPEVKACSSDGNVRHPIRVVVDPEALVPTDLSGVSWTARWIGNATTSTFSCVGTCRGAGDARLYMQVPTPTDVTLSVPSLTDPAGNVGPESQCTIAYPGWRPPRGASGRDPTAGLLGRTVAVSRSSGGVFGTWLAWIDHEGRAWSSVTEDDGAVSTAALTAPGATASEVLAGVLTESGVGNAWIEGSGGGAGVRWTGLAAGVGAGAPRELASRNGVLVWIEDDPAGGTRVAYRQASASGVTAYVPSAPGAVASSPATSGTGTVAWVERDGGTARVRVWDLAGDPVSFDLDPFADAGNVDVLAHEIAWEEGGRIAWSSRGVGPWSPPVVVSDSAQPARRPRFYRRAGGISDWPSLSWIEQGPTDERPVARRRVGAAEWQDESPGAEIGAVPLGSLAASGDLGAFAWVDPAGDVHAVVRNE
jgi:hypothetical protein